MRYFHLCLLLAVLVVTVAVLNTCGAGSKSSDPLPINQPPVAKLSVTPSSGTAPLTVTASTAGSSDPDGTIASTKIDFGDGTVVNSGSASHVYNSAGGSVVTATVTDNGGASSVATANVAVSSATGNQPPVAKLSLTPISGTAPLTVSASTAGSSDPDGTIASAKIDFGDGTVVNSSSASHTYISVGTFTVKGTVTDNGGASSVATASVTVSSAPNQPPVAKLSVTPSSGTAPLTVTASTAGSSDPDGTIANSKIDFGDGAVASSGSASHTYSAAGSFTVTGTVTDNSGASASASATVSVSPANTGAWRAPIGIPAPSFGIGDTAPARPTPWQSDVANYYYVQGDANCSDSHTYGNPTAPRCTIPLALRPGAVVELHGTYTQGHTESSAIQVTGTAAQPVYIRGLDNATNRPVITTHLSIYGYYAIVENISFDHRALTAAGGSPDIGVPAAATGSPKCATDISAACSHHIVFRHTEMQGSTGASSFRQCGGFNAGGWMTDLPAGSSQHDFVFWDNNVHDEGQTNPATDEDQPCKAFNVGRYAHHVWIVDNQCYNLAQNCVQIVPTNDGAASNDTHHIYVGRNVASKVGKAAFFAKASSDVVFSQNVAHDPVAKTYSPAVCYGWQYGPQRIWFLYNEGYNCAYGVFGGSDNLGPNQHIYIVGNIFHDITNDGVYNSMFNPADTWSAAAIMSASGTDLHIVNNLIWRVNQANGINITQTGFSGSHEIVNNIIGNFLNSNSRDIFMEDGGEFASATLDYNLFYPSPSSLLVWDGGGQLSSISAMKSAGKCANCLLVNPLFVNAAASDFHLQSGSPAINKGTLASVIATFDQYYSTSEFGGQKNIIAVDGANVSRPKGTAWDIGPYEY